MRTQLDQQKRQHRERAQPANRQRLGLLEKHKDYVKRAKDYHSKEDRIKKLREKAATRNKDEFYFGMIKSKTEKGVHVQDRGNDPMPVDIVKLLKTQDVGYIRTLISTEEKLIQRLKEELGAAVALEEDTAQDNASDDDMYDSEDEPERDFGEGTSKQGILALLGNGGVAKGKKTVFVDSAKEVAKFRPNKQQPTATAQSSKKAGKSAAKTTVLDSESLIQANVARKEHISSQAELLGARLERLSLLQRTFREMQVQRAIMGKGSKQVVGNKKTGLNAEDERLNEADLDELELKRLGNRKKKLPEPERGVKTGARVWKWKTERKR